MLLVSGFGRFDELGIRRKKSGPDRSGLAHYPRIRFRIGDLTGLAPIFSVTECLLADRLQQIRFRLWRVRVVDRKVGIKIQLQPVHVFRKRLCERICFRARIG